jgi:bifunctional non-homologous end joining protein LigD
LDSRNAKDFTATFPEIAQAITDALPGRRVALDGEVVAHSPASGAPDFAQLQRRLGLTPSAELLAQVPVHYIVFDLLALDDAPTTALPYETRRRLLAELELAHPRLSVPAHQVDVDPAALFDIAAQHQLEGVVGKRLDSPYRPGRSPAWEKHAIRRRLETAVGGWIPSNAGRGHGLGSLLLGRPAPLRDAGSRVRVEFVGAVGTGWTQDLARRILAQLSELERPSSPFSTSVPREYTRFAHWVEPQLIIDVDYRNWTPTGYLRHPSFKGLRPDRDLVELARQA